MSSIDRYSEYFQEYLRSLSKDTYIDILEHCFAEITVTDAEGYVIYANPASLQYHGMSSEDMCKLNFFYFLQRVVDPAVCGLCHRK